MQNVSVKVGDITRLKVDAIVNAANTTLLGGGGVDGAIHRAAGPELLEYCRRLPESAPGVRCPTGESRLTPGFDLPAEYVIHTVGPVWQGGDQGEPLLLAGCYRSALELAAQQGVESIAFPAISCGVFGYPVAQACDIAVATIAQVLATGSKFREITLVGFDQAMCAELSAALRRKRS
jgi:O-acetyl-ADP-ribose deacetylase (regulator of RNase III)